MAGAPRSDRLGICVKPAGRTPPLARAPLREAADACFASARHPRPTGRVSLRSGAPARSACAPLPERRVAACGRWPARSRSAGRTDLIRNGRVACVGRSPAENWTSLNCCASTEPAIAPPSTARCRMSIRSCGRSLASSCGVSPTPPSCRPPSWFRKPTCSWSRSAVSTGRTVATSSRSARAPCGASQSTSRAVAARRTAAVASRSNWSRAVRSSQP